MPRASSPNSRAAKPTDPAKAVTIAGRGAVGRKGPVSQYRNTFPVPTGCADPGGGPAQSGPPG
ncbi:hypothetical protein GCM10009539_35890 [Cryptosporangium japonicum]|uniref:Uncharacterized protein n=1 Tax=Cryptosporangium japonicum TaxID=80872 RepID=A0ABN0UDY9_9ACTN